MAAGDITFYNKFKEGLLDQDGGGLLSSLPVDFDTSGDTIKIGVLDNTFSPDVGDSTTQEHWDDVSAKEVTTGTGYSAGGPALASQAVTLSGGVAKFDAADVTLLQDSGTGFTNGRYIVFYKDSGSAATSPLIAYGDLGSDQDLTGNDLDFVWASTGIFTLT